VIAGKLVVLGRDQMKGSELLAVDVASGKVLWRTDRSDLGSSFGSPAIWKHGRDTEIVMPGYLQMRAYSLADGKEKWRVRGLPVAVCTTPVVGKDWLYFAGWSPGKDQPMPTFETLAATEDKDKDGVISYEEASPFVQNFFSSYDANRDKRLTAEEWNNFRENLMKGENSLIAIKPGGKGDVTTSHVAWKQTRGLPYVASPLFYRGNIYLIKDGGMMSCYNAQTGQAVYQQERIGVVGSYYTSPVAADGRIYVASVNGVLSVIKAGEKPDVIGHTDFKERLVATPALVDNKIYIRTAEHVWAFGK
jgi:outer membrane protein assembly factor BamB